MVEQNSVLSARAIHKRYPGRTVLDGVNIDIYPGELTLIAGPSGSGKTTLLNVLSGIERPDYGEVRHRGDSVYARSDRELTKWRGENMGYVFQDPALLAGLTVANNIVVPTRVVRGRVDKPWVAEVCLGVGAGHLLNRQTTTNLSGGEKQRIALARALAGRPEILFADEPTGALDGGTKVEIHEVLRDIVGRLGTTVVMVSHDDLSPDYADRIVRLQDGVIESDIVCSPEKVKGI